MPFSHLADELKDLEASGLRRHRRVLESPQGARIVVGGREYLSFCSNDYLGLASHPKIIQALQQGAQQYGAGSGASHLVSGHFEAHQQLEQALAEFVGKPAALSFSTGYMANLGAVQALVGRGDTVFADKLNHASLNDAMLLSRAEVKRYRHNDMAQLEKLLANSCGYYSEFPLPNPPPMGEGTSEKGNIQFLGERTNEMKRGVNSGRKLIITDAVFSMDGDIALLPQLLALSEKYDAWLMVDDAHGFGVLGEQGRGILHHLSPLPNPLPQAGEGTGSLSRLRERVGERVDSPRIIYMATLGKAAGVSGAFVAAEEVVIQTLLQNARSYIYTTASPPALSVALLASLKILREEDSRRDRLQQLIAQLRKGLSGLPWALMQSDTPIQPLVVGTNEAVVALSEALRARGIWVPAIRPPTVPQGTARLRISLSAAHDTADVEILIEALHELAHE